MRTLLMGVLLLGQACPSSANPCSVLLDQVHWTAHEASEAEGFRAVGVEEIGRILQQIETTRFGLWDKIMMALGGTGLVGASAYSLMALFTWNLGYGEVALGSFGASLLAFSSIGLTRSRMERFFEAAKFWTLSRVEFDDSAISGIARDSAGQYYRVIFGTRSGAQPVLFGIRRKINLPRFSIRPALESIL